MPEGKITHIRLDPEHENKLNECLEYYKKQIPSINKSMVIKTAIHSLWLDIKELQNENNT